MAAPGENQLTPAMIRAEAVLRMHGVPDEGGALLQGPRPRAKIDAIIRDVRIANAAAEAESE